MNNAGQNAFAKFRRELACGYVHEKCVTDDPPFFLINDNAPRLSSRCCAPRVPLFRTRNFRDPRNTLKARSVRPGSFIDWQEIPLPLQEEKEEGRK